MQSVELLDEVRPPDEPSSRAADGARSRRLRMLWPVAAAVALALVGTQAVIAARDRSATGRIQALPGVVRGIGPDVSPLWQVDERDADYLDRSVTVDGTVIGVRTAPDGSQRIEARDVSTGSGRWSAPLRGPDPELALRGGAASRSLCQSVPTAPGDHAALVACLGSDAAVSVGRSGRTTYVRAPVRSHVVVIDTADGHVVADQPAPAAIAFTTLPGLVVLGTPADDGHAALTAQDPLTGARAWRFVSPAPDIAPAGDVAGFRLFRLGDEIGLQEANRQVTLLSAAGGVARARTRVLDGTPVVVGSDRLELLSGFAEARPLTTIVRPGRPDAYVPGYLLARSVDDGSLGNVEITYGSLVQAWDSSSGKLLWQADGPVAGPAVVLRGLVFSMGWSGAGEVRAFDGRTGALVWSVHVGSYDETQTLLTDGTSIVVANAPAPGEGSGTIEGFALDTGVRLWTTRTTALLGTLTVRGHVLVSASAAASVVLGSLKDERVGVAGP